MLLRRDETIKLNSILFPFFNKGLTKQITLFKKKLNWEGHMRKEDPPVVVKQSFNVSAERLWEAITNIDEMREWFFPNIPEFEPKIGFNTKFTVTNEGRDFPHLWEITEVIPQKLIIYNWKYEGYPGDSFVKFEIEERENQTILKLEFEVTEDFPDNIPEFKRESCIGGWQYFINQSLKNYLSQ